jgi:integrase
MRIPIKPLCEEKRVRNDGTSLIYFQFFHDGEHRIFLSTGLGIPPEFWDKRKEAVKDTLPTEFGSPAKLNEEIDRQQKLAVDLIQLAKGQGIAEIGPYVKEKYYPFLDLPKLAREDFSLKSSYVPEVRKKKEPFFQQWDQYILSKKGQVADSTVTAYGNIIGQLKAFEEFRGQTIRFSNLDFNFYDELVGFLTYEYKIPRKKVPVFGLRVNTIGKTIKQLRIFLKDRVRRKIIPPVDLEGWHIPEEETDAIYLTYDEISEIYRVDLSDHSDLQISRNIFVLACLTGLRFSDFSVLKPEDLQNDMLYKKQQKSTRWVVIPMRKEAKEIFTAEFKSRIPNIHNVTFNEQIKRIAELAGINQLIKFSYKKGNKMIEEIRPKFAWITSHTARRSFCTNEFMAGTPVKLIMLISGHKSEKDFYRYIRIDAREAAERIKELWMERDSMEVFKNPLKKALNLQNA